MSTNVLTTSVNMLFDRYISLSGMATERPQLQEDLADFVRRVRNEKGLSQRDVETRSGGEISKGYIGQIENRTVLGHSVTPQKLTVLARGLGISADEIFAIARGQAGVGELSLEEARLIDGFRRLAPDRQGIALGMMDVLTKGQAGTARHPAVTDTPPDVPLPETTPEDLGEEEEGEGWHNAASDKNGTDS